ncbi:unnamed protein product [Cuscuta europaea]|uniref:HTH three-helical bundle domain-containing protein n=1 Tax=Cuscuta europaea TaxID=41803 RepID=A0A9P1EFK1_CUSEU|nr:unnamed protein product [Cuscuta europaea]
MGEEQVFPNSNELVVAESLLLLSFTPPSPSLPSMIKHESSLPLIDLSTGTVCFSKSKPQSCASILSDVTWDGDGSSVDAQSHSCRKKLEVVRKKRSLSFCISDEEKIRPVKEMPVVTKPPAASSCLSNESESSTISSAGSHGSASIMGKQRDKAKPVTEVLKSKKKRPELTHIRRRSEAILNILSHESASEVKIRKLLGDSPDTSKALRLLLKLEEVTRSGAGGQKDPYIYTIRSAHK